MWITGTTNILLSQPPSPIFLQVNDFPSATLVPRIYLLFHLSFHHLLSRQACLANGSARLCEDLALCSCAAPMMQWERNVQLQSITRVETKNGSVQARMRICDLIFKKSTQTHWSIYARLEDEEEEQGLSAFREPEEEGWRTL